MCLKPLEDQPDINKHIIKLIIDGPSKEELYQEISHLTEDYVYYRNDENIDDKIKDLKRGAKAGTTTGR